MLLQMCKMFGCGGNEASLSLSLLLRYIPESALLLSGTQLTYNCGLAKLLSTVKFSLKTKLFNIAYCKHEHSAYCLPLCTGVLVHLQYMMLIRCV